MNCEVADACLNSLVNFFQQHEGTEGYLRSLGEMTLFVAACRFAQKLQTSIKDWMKLSKSTT